jgi:hypothetical protein
LRSGHDFAADHRRNYNLISGCYDVLVLVAAMITMIADDDDCDSCRSRWLIIVMVFRVDSAHMDGCLSRIC